MRGVPRQLTESQTLFLQWLLEGDDRDPRALLEAHPEHAEELEAIWERYRRIEALDAAETVSDTADEAPVPATIHLGHYTFSGRVLDGDPPRVAVVRDENLGRDLVMKVHREVEGESPPESLRRFLREAALLGELDHPGTPPIHEVGVDRNGRAFFTTTLRTGQHLREGIEAVRTKRAGYSLARGVRVLIAVCETLASAHARGIVHGDLSAADVYVGELEEVLVTGWGAARVVREPEVDELEVRVHAALSLEELFGTSPGSPTSERARTATAEIGPATPSPEHTDPDPSTDRRAVGEMVGELLAAAYPVERARPAELVAIAEAARGGDPRGGYRDVSQLAEDLRAFLELRVVRAHRTGALEELRQWSRRNRGVVAVALVALLLVAGSLGGYALGEARKGQQILELSDLQAIEILRRAADELWVAPRDRAGPGWLERAEAVMGAAESLVDRIETDRASHGTLTSERDARSFERIFAERAPRYLGGEHQRLHGIEHYQTCLDEYLRIRPAFEAGTASPADLARREYLVAELDAQWKAEQAPHGENPLNAVYENPLSPEERIDPDGDPAEWRALQLERLFREADELSRVTGSDDRTTQSVANRGVIADLSWELEHRRRWLEETDAAVRESWARAYESVLSPEDAGRQPPRYPLLPLGRSEENGLWEFWDPRTGIRPAFRSDRIPPQEVDAGVVYVLVPGREASGNGSALAPFFISRYELTQAQWRLFDLSRSFYWPGSSEGDEHGVTPRHPAEQKDRPRIEWTMKRLGVTLPTEAQWEHAAGPGQAAGEVPANLAGAEDGFAVHAPVGSFPPGPFGLFDVSGNVSEVCRVAGSDELEWVRRGSAWDDPPERARLSLRREYEWQTSNTGIRPVMELLP